MAAAAGSSSASARARPTWAGAQLASASMAMRNDFTASAGVCFSWNSMPHAVFTAGSFFSAADASR